MPIAYRIDANTGIMTSTYTEGITLDDLKTHLETIANDAEVQKVERILVDLRPAYSRLKIASEIETFERIYLDFLPKIAAHYWAIVVDSPIETALSIMVKSVFERNGKQMKICYDTSSAESYLNACQRPT